jgi:ATP-dependent Lon protease
MSSNKADSKQKYNLRNKKYRKSKDETSSSDDSTSETLYTSTSELNEDSEDTDFTECSDIVSDSAENADFDRKKFRKALAELFPSKYMDTKVANDEKASKHKPSKSSSKSSKSTTKNEKKHRKSHKHHRKTVDSSDEGDASEDEEDEEEIEKDSERERKTHRKNEKDKSYNIIITAVGEEYDNDEEGYFEDTEEDYTESDEDDECDSDDEKTFMKETYEVIPEVVAVAEDVADAEPSSPSKKHGKKRKSINQLPPDEINEITDVENEYLELVDLKKQLTEQLIKKPNNKILKRSIQECKDSIHALVKQTRKENTKKYHKLIHSASKPTNEIDYFKTKLSNKEQRKAMEDLQEINTHIYIDKPYRLALLQSKMPAKFKAIAMQKLNVLKTMDPSDHEYYKIKNWVDTFMKIPFGIYKSVSVSMSDGLPKCNEFITNAKKTLDDCTYGLNDAKMQIMQMLGQWIVNPTSLGTSIAIHGPMGTGKTTLVKEGISKILGREFTFIALGGSGDASFLEGHSYTYEGSTWGKIVQILVESKCMNPVFYFDELDKVSDTPRGQEIIGILTHLTDTAQNSQFHDKYFSEIDFDLSKCLFIFSYNDETMINPILRDRMYRIRTKGYETAEKVVIARNHLLPKIREQVSFTEHDVIIPDEMIRYIINTFTKTESGVRNLKRCLEMIYSKLNLFRLISPENKLFAKDMTLEVSFPITITRKEIDTFIKNDEVINQSMLAMYV